MAEPHREEEAGVSQSPALLNAIPEKQWDLPVGFVARGEERGEERGGEIVTLRELLKETPDILPLAQLTERQRDWLVARRIEAQGKFELAMYGVDGILDKERAIHEVESGSRVGKTITQVEMLMIEEMISLARGEELAD